MPALESLEVKGCGRVEQVADDHMPAVRRLWLSDLNILKQLPNLIDSARLGWKLLEQLPNFIELGLDSELPKCKIGIEIALATT
uniref:Uncharacterized protein n=1 Tax=Nymphaea colorata TaxID=210225 RepID=A0A5K1HEX4_9MAGN|nr:unnamed protein product [Nymphaea colorata]